MHRQIQALAAELAALPPREIAKLPIDEQTRDQLALAAGMPANGTRVRQLKHVAHLLEAQDMEGLQTLLNRRHLPDREYTARQRILEQTRAKLLSDLDQEKRLLEEYPSLAAHNFQLLCQQARAEQATGQPRGAGRALFRLLAQELK